MEGESHSLQQTVTSPECQPLGQGLWGFTHSDLAQSLKEKNQPIREGVGKALV